ncbi:MAG: 1-acylglycerol-3-phosphate O-acyltransferase [Neisseria sp.]|uniref:1-acylglycerol-3-phosphate O-acyltransferase n=1 Tax=Neisseria sp. TaxID=192066 RepID=UPI0026DC6EB1|nr:1-acylglycerol-3-phosphate O-acyltransferase [Neisseria sp.]MDO4640576.1 1-acylglycerol-3-phosphate O-acyltransferase [Neisseria sp.]
MPYKKTPFLQRIKRLWRICVLIVGQGRLLTRPESANQETRNRIIHDISSQALAILNAKLYVRTPPQTCEHNMLVVSNHVSWLDIFAIGSLCPSSFIAKKEMQSWPLLGKIATNAGTVFIDRKNRKNIDPINTAIATSLNAGQNVCFFPEAGTSLGTGILPFKAALFESAIQANAPIQAIALRYYDPSGQRTTVPSYANVNLVKSIWQILAMPEILITADFAPPILPDSQPDQDRFALKDQAECYIGEKVNEDAPMPV